MSASRRSLLAGIAGTVAATKLSPAQSTARAATAASSAASPIDLPTFTGGEYNAVVVDLVRQVISTIEASVPERHQRSALSGIASYLLEAGLGKYGDEYGDTGEPLYSVTDRVMLMFRALGEGTPAGLLDYSLPPQEYLEYQRHETRQKRRTTS